MLLNEVTFLNNHLNLYYFYCVHNQSLQTKQRGWQQNRKCSKAHERKRDRSENYGKSVDISYDRKQRNFQSAGMQQ